MIKYNLICHNNHEFESWFFDSEEFDRLNKKKLLECIHCNSNKITKSIMAPNISGIKEKNVYLDNHYQKNKFQETKQSLLKLREYVEKNFEYVGENFSKKVRDIYYDKKYNKTIYGSTTAKERKELAEEGIELISIPWVEKEN